MRLKTTILIMLIAVLVYTLQPCSAAEYEGLSEKIGLRILYAGHPGSEREKDFVDFLSAYFTEVKTVDLKEFKEDNTAGFDVTILDYDGDGFKAPRLKLSESYSRATVTVGVTGALICGNLKLKTGYL